MTHPKYVTWSVCLAALTLGAAACASLAGVEDGELVSTGGGGGTTGGGGATAGGGAAGGGGTVSSGGGAAGVGGTSSGGAAGSGGTAGATTGGTGGTTGGTGGTTGGTGGTTGGTGGTTGGTGGTTGGTGGTTGGTGGTTGGTGGTTGGTGGTATGGTGGVTGNKYSQEVLADAPVAYWRLDDAAGATSVVDSSGNNHTCTLTNNKIVLGKPGVSNTAAQFDGTGYIDCGDKFGFDGQLPMSVEGWFYPIGPDYGFLGKGDYTSGSGYDGWSFAEGSGVLQAIRGGGVITHPAMPQTQFTYVAMTYDGTTWALYVGGTLHSSKASLTAVSKHTNSFRIGNVYQWKGFTGWIDEVAIYDKALSATRIAAHFNASK